MAGSSQRLIDELTTDELFPKLSEHRRGESHRDDRDRKKQNTRKHQHLLG